MMLIDDGRGRMTSESCPPTSSIDRAASDAVLGDRTTSVGDQSPASPNEQTVSHADFWLARGIRASHFVAPAPAIAHSRHRRWVFRGVLNL